MGSGWEILSNDDSHHFNFIHPSKCMKFSRHNFIERNENEKECVVSATSLGLFPVVYFSIFSSKKAPRSLTVDTVIPFNSMR